MALACHQLSLPHIHSLSLSRPRHTSLHSRFLPPSQHVFPASQPFHFLNAQWHNRAAKFSPLATARAQGMGDSPKRFDGPSDRRRNLEKLLEPPPKSPNYLLWATGFLLVYLTRNAIAAELINWAALAGGLALTLTQSAQSTLLSFLSFLLQKVQGPLTLALTLFGWAGLFTRDVYTLIVRTTSVGGTLKAIVLATIVLSLGEATRSTAVSGQPLTLTIATLLGVGGALGFLHHTEFVFLLLVLVGFSLLVQKKDAVSAFMPMTAVLVALAEPWVKGVTLASFLTLAVYNHWKNPEEQAMLTGTNRRIVQPMIMVVAAMLLGITVAARYLYARHVLWLAR